MTPDEILKQAQNAAKMASDKLATKNTKVITIRKSKVFIFYFKQNIYLLYIIYVTVYI